MRIGLFTESYVPVINGVSTSVRTLAEELARAGQEPIIIAPGFAGYVDSDPIPVLRIPSWRTIVNPDNPFAYPPLPLIGSPAALRGVSFDIVHTQHPFGMGLQAYRIAQLLKIPLIATFHTLYTDYTHYLPLPRSLTSAAIAVALRRFYQTCDAVILPSHEARRRLEAIGVDSRRLRVIPTGIPSAQPVEQSEIERVRRQFDLPEDAKVILYVGRLAQEKNLDLLIDAFMALEDETALLLLVGDGPDADEVKTRVEAAGNGSRVRFAGFMPHEALPPVYASATLFAFPSGTETQGLAIAEAQSYGLPCVVVGDGGAPESVRDGIDAIIVRSELSAFHDALAELLHNNERRQKMSVAARQNPFRLTPEEMAYQVIEVYQSVK
jgi:glycosyltransferase involved in cell wall biosynthesis